MYGGQRNWFSPATMGDPGIKLTWLGLAASTFDPLCHLIGPKSIFYRWVTEELECELSVRLHPYRRQSVSV